MARWFSADTHIGHANIIRYCDRPYADAHTMNLGLIARFKERLGSDDDLWILGDLVMSDPKKSLPVLARFNATLHLVAGNHDRCHPVNAAPGSAKALRWERDYLELTGAASLTLTNTSLILADGSDVQLSHFPFGWDVHDLTAGRGRAPADRFAPWRPVDDGRWLLCGHVHEKWRQRGRQINVGVDAWGGRPVSEEQILELIAAGPADRDILPWD